MIPLHYVRTWYPGLWSCADKPPWEAQPAAQKHAHAGSRTRVTSMGGLYDTVTLRALATKVQEVFPADAVMFAGLFCLGCSCGRSRISGLVVEFIVAIDETRVRFPADAILRPGLRFVYGILEETQHVDHTSAALAQLVRA